MVAFLKTSDGILLRYKCWKASKNTGMKPRILLLQGRAVCLEKIEGVANILQERGYEVWSFDWRGQGLSTREAGKRCHIKDYKFYVKDLDFFISSFLKNTTQSHPLVILGQSMGGHIGLRYMSENPGVVDGAVMTAPMLELNTGSYSKSISRWLAALCAYSGFGKSYIYSAKNYDPSKLDFEGNLLTHNKEIFYHHRHIQMIKPETIVNGVTFGWVNATLKSQKKLNTPKQLGLISAPVKIYVAEEESVVDNSNLEKITSWIPTCDVELIKGARHLLLFEMEPLTTKIFNGLDDFVNHHIDTSLYKNLSILMTRNRKRELIHLPVST